MLKFGKGLVLAVGFALPVTASAQTGALAGDVQYCAALTHLYRTYVNNPQDPRPVQITPSVEYEHAIARCQAGDPAAGIPPLEKVLRNNKITLPARG